MEFIELNKDNWQECASLTTEEDKYIAPNLFSIAEAQFYEEVSSRAIYVDNKLVGYTMYGEDEDYPDIFFIDRFMIAKDFRRQGLGSKAIKKLVDLGFEQGYNRIETSTALENKAMQALLEKNGFKTNNVIRDREIVYFYLR